MHSQQPAARSPAHLAAQVDHALKQVRQQDPSRTRQDVLTLLTQSLYLEVRPAPNPPPHGPLVLTVAGTITTHYRGGAYQTPLVIYVPPQYPHAPPTIMLTPTRDMTFDRRCPHIDGDTGRVTHAYVNAEWRPATSTLVECVYIMASCFGDGGVPPLRADRGGAQPPMQQPQRAAPIYGYPQGAHGHPPAPQHQYPQSSVQPYPPLAGSYPPGLGAAARPPYIQPPPITAQYAPSPYGYPSATPQQQQGYPFGGAGASASAAAGASAAARAAPPSVSSSSSGHPAGLTRQSSDTELRAQVQKALTARLQAKLRGEYERLTKAAEELVSTGDKLASRRKAAQASLAGLQQRQATLSAYSSEVQGRRDAAAAWLAQYDAAVASTAGADASASSAAADGAGSVASGRSGLAAWASRGGETDDVVPTSALGRQLLHRVAEDVAYEDYFPHIDEALWSHRIRPEEALQEVRDGARRQFQARALAKKIDAALGKVARDEQALLSQDGFGSPTVHTREQLKGLSIGAVERAGQ